VKVEQENTTIKADEMVYFEETGDYCRRNVRYDDPQFFFSAKTAEMNMEKKPAAP